MAQDGNLVQSIRWNAYNSFLTELRIVLMRIAQVCPRYNPDIGGVETHVKEISERLAKRGFDVEVLTTDPTGKLPRDEMINDIEVRRFRSWAPSEAYYFSRSLERYLMRSSDDYDTVHVHNYHALPALYAAQAKDRNKLILTPHYHGSGHTFLRSSLHMLYRFIGKKIFEKPEKIVCVSNYERNLILNRFRVDENKVVLIPNGINLEEFKDLKRTHKDNRVILYVGRLEKYKGVHSLIKALPKLDDDIVLEIVGKGPYKKSLVSLISRLGVESRVRFFQDLPRNELVQKYVDADLYVLLSRYEAYGICVAEALACRTPCIVANTSALTEWVDNENCFGINNPISLDELVNLLNNVIGRSVNGLRLPDWDEVAEKLVNLYESC